MYFLMILNNQVDSYKYLPMNNLTFANKIFRVAFLNSPKDRKKYIQTDISSKLIDK